MEQANVSPNRARSMTLPVVNHVLNDLNAAGMNEASSSPDAAATTPRPRLFLRRRFASADQVTTDRPDVQGCDSKESSSSTPRSPRFLRRRLIRATTNPGAVTLEETTPSAVAPTASLPTITASDLTLAEKLTLLSGASLWSTAGVPRLGIQPRNLCDGPHGVRKPPDGHDTNLHASAPATCFPTASAVACAWDEALLQLLGAALSRECLVLQVHVLLGPGLNIKRHAAGGRNFEYYSEDPILSGRCARAAVFGVQASGQVGACVKHFAVNNQETLRFVTNAVVDLRTMHEVYLRAFRMVCSSRQGCRRDGGSANQDDDPSVPWSIMCAYNRVNGDYCSEHAYLNQHLLRNVWNYQGVLMTDWGATNNRTAGIMASVDLEMPGSHGAHHRAIVKALQRFQKNQRDDQRRQNADDNDDCNVCSPTLRTMGLTVREDALEEAPGLDRAASSGTTLPPDPAEPAAATSRLDDKLALDVQCVDQSVNRVLRLVQRGNQNLDPDAFFVDLDAHHELAHYAALQCVVLLKNDDNLAPLSVGDFMSDSGSALTAAKIGLIGDFGKDHPRYQGMGSSRVSSYKVSSVYERLCHYVDPSQILLASGYDADDDHPTLTNGKLLTEAVTVARAAHTVILCIGLPEIMESEGFDRTHLQLPAQHQALVTAVRAVCPRTVVVLSNGGVVTMEPWIHHVPVVYECYLLGQAGGAAVVDLIFGVASPCGKLAETFPIHQTDILADKYFPGNRHCVEYREGLDVGYRYFDSAHRPVQFCFGHGLSYTTFSYSNATAVVLEDEVTSKLVVVQFDVTNTGTKFTASEIVQCYVHDCECSVYRPVHELRDYTKVCDIAPGETRTVRWELDFEAFSFFDVGRDEWIVEPGFFEIEAAASSRDVRIRLNIELKTGLIASREAATSYPPVRQSLHVPRNNRERSKSFDLDMDVTHNVVDDDTFYRRLSAGRGGAARSAHRRRQSSTSALFLRDPSQMSTSMGVLLPQHDLHSFRRANEKPHFDRNSLLKEVADSRLIGKLLMFATFRGASQDQPTDPRHKKRQERLIRATVENLPLRALVLFSGGAMSFETLDALIFWMNYEFWKAGKSFGKSLAHMFAGNNAK
jgi:beta-glucosidase